MWHFERKFIKNDDLARGVLPEHYINPVFAITALLLCLPQVQIVAQSGWDITLGTVAILCICVLIARMIALDLAYHLLLDIYTLPLLASGLGLAWYIFDVPLWHVFAGAAVGFLIPLFLTLIVSKIKGTPAGMGGGDIKLMAACGAWLGVWHLPIFLFLACFITLFGAVSFYRNKELPFGPGLCLSLWALLNFPILEKLMNYGL